MAQRSALAEQVPQGLMKLPGILPELHREPLQEWQSLLLQPSSVHSSSACCTLAIREPPAFHKTAPWNHHEQTCIHKYPVCERHSLQPSEVQLHQPMEEQLQGLPLEQELKLADEVPQPIHQQ